MDHEREGDRDGEWRHIRGVLHYQLRELRLVIDRVDAAVDALRLWQAHVDERMAHWAERIAKLERHHDEPPPDQVPLWLKVIAGALVVVSTALAVTSRLPL